MAASSYLRANIKEDLNKAHDEVINLALMFP
jgi:hypothetical protein